MKKLTFLILSLLLLVLTLKAQPLSVWKYYREVTINNSGNTESLTDYSVLLIVDTKTLILQGRMNPDGSDLRFTTDFNTELNYWIESGIQNELGINNNSTHIWVKVSSIPSSTNTKIYMLYGNPTAQTKSNIETAFIFGDDFNDNSLNTTKWETYFVNQGLLREQNQRLEHNSPKTNPGSSSSIYSRQSFTGPMVLEMRFKKGGYVYRGAGLTTGINNDNNRAGFNWSDCCGFGGNVTLNGVNTSYDFRNDFWSREHNPEYYLKLIRDKDSTFTFAETIPSFEDDGFKHWEYKMSGVKIPLDYALKISTSEGVWTYAWWLWEMYEDDIRVRKYSFPEPSTSFGQEQLFSTIITNNTTVNWLETFEIPVITTELKPDSNYISYQFNLNYDNTKLQYSNKSLDGTIAENGTLLVNETSPGSLAVSYMTASPLQGAGDIVKLQFNAINVGAAPLTISNFLYNNTSVTTENGTVTVQDITPPTAAITYSDADGNVRYGENLIITATFSEPMANSPVPQIILSGANTLAATNMTRVSETVYTYTHSVALGNGAVTVSLATGTDTHGNVITSAPTSGNTFTVIPITYGDVDDNKFIRAYDAALTLQYSVGLNPLPIVDPLPWEAWRIVTANVDGVGSITAYDASLILQYSAGIITVFPAGSKKSGKEPAEIEIAVEKGFALFRSKGDLYGLNISVTKDFNNLGQPQILNSNMISVANISETNYTIGLATAYPPKNGDVFMKIPIIGSTSSDITFNLISNTENVAITVNLATGIPEIKENTLSMFPNPVTNQLTINSINKNAKVSIYDLAGKLLICKTAKSTTEIIDVSNLANGAYTITVTDKDVTKTGKLIKQ